MLLHGFSGSPSELQVMGTVLAGKGYTVKCPLLPGHGTTMDDLEKYTWRDWYDTAVREYTELRQKCEKVFAIGLSMGGALALHLAAHYPVDGIVGLASGVKLRDWRAKLLPVLHRYPIRIWKIRNAFARGRKPSRFAYDYYSSIASWQVIRFYRHLKEDLPEITAPVLLIHSKYDRTMIYENTDIVNSLIRSKNKKVVALESADHIITLGNNQKTIHREILQFVSSLDFT